MLCLSDFSSLECLVTKVKTRSKLGQYVELIRVMRSSFGHVFSM